MKNYVFRKCLLCGNKFHTYPSVNKLYCSRKCVDKSKVHRIEKKCVYCGDSFFVTQSQMKRMVKYCSALCRETDQYGALFDELDQNEFEKQYVKNTQREMVELYGVNRETINRWARKLKLPRKHGRWRDTNIVLSKKQIEIIQGSMLGDGSLEKVVKKGKGVMDKMKNSRFTESHGIKQAGWLKWKQIAIKSVCSKYKERVAFGRKNIDGKVVQDKTKTYKGCMLKTICHPIFTEMELNWYKRNSDGSYIFKKQGKNTRRLKNLPRNFKLTPLTIAVWFMDDGHNLSGKACFLYPLDFTYKEVCVLAKQLKEFGIIGNVKKTAKPEQFLIRIGKKCYDNFIKLVKYALSGIPECMKYKVA